MGNAIPSFHNAQQNIPRNRKKGKQPWPVYKGKCRKTDWRLKKQRCPT
jgi:hypothetical protein